MTASILPEETDLIKAMLDFFDVLEGSARSLEPHRITFYLIDLVGRFHGYYNKARVLGNEAGPHDGEAGAALRAAKGDPRGPFDPRRLGAGEDGAHRRGRGDKFLVLGYSKYPAAALAAGYY